jgi:hypothetical protein
MGKQDDQTSGAPGGQVFELTMDNPEDQDELNRRMRKPGEPDHSPTATIGRPTPGRSAPESAEEKTGTSSAETH